MNDTYELWDIQTGNIVGSFATEDEGIEVVRTLLDSYGRAYAADLSLSRRDDDGVARVVAMGDQLLRLIAHRDREATIQAAPVRASS